MSCSQFRTNLKMGNKSDDNLGLRPMNVEEIAKRAGNFEYNARIPLSQWLRAADTLQKEVHQIYTIKGEIEMKKLCS